TRSVLLSRDRSAPTIYTLSLHDALPISIPREAPVTTATRFSDTCLPPRFGKGPRCLSFHLARQRLFLRIPPFAPGVPGSCPLPRSEEHTSELQSRENLVCRLLLEKKNKT